jgi:predicted TIM-barrel fold metal-dependent hydrolase
MDSLEWVAKRGAVTAMLPTNVYGRNLGESFFYPIYEAAEKIGMTLSVHPQTMIGEGVFDRFPRLRVGFMEGGADWLPFWMERLDEHVEKLAPQMPNLRRRPSEIIRSEQIVLTCESEESGLDRVLEAAGAGTVLYASDYCHWDCNFPDSVKDICEARDLSLAQKERILGRNAVEFFGLTNLPEPNALKTARWGWTREEPVSAQGALR